LLSAYLEFKYIPKPPLEQFGFGRYEDDFRDLLGKLLIYNPATRYTAAQVIIPRSMLIHSPYHLFQSLDHPYFSSPPQPTNPADLPKTKQSLQPRALPPEVLNGGLPVQELAEKGGGGVSDDNSKKRKSSQVVGGEISEQTLKKIARKLEFGQQ
jgi:serine/threonine protein kinase